MTRLFAHLSNELPPEPVYSFDGLLRQLRAFKVNPVFRSWPLDHKNQFSDFVDYLAALLGDTDDQKVTLSFDFAECSRQVKPPKFRVLTRGEKDTPPSSF